MIENSTIKRDIRTTKNTPGAYEWWYFDAVSNDGRTKFVIIFYEGNPFSRRYINRQENTHDAYAKEFPAISISVYQNDQPVYYSFTEVEPNNATFSDDVPFVQIGNHMMEAQEQAGDLQYRIELNEELASGDSIEADITFTSNGQINESVALPLEKSGHHVWNIIQPSAQVSGEIVCTADGQNQTLIPFEGTGYHDHNMGNEPLKEQFEDWYWGRFHFPDHTFIYYAMDNIEQETYGWLIENYTGNVVQEYKRMQRSDTSMTLYGLMTDRKLTFSSPDSEILVQQARLLDNGPFYQRYSSDVFLEIPSQNVLESVEGVSEYICPPRIYNKLFWPLTNMRIRYEQESPHWVQRSKMLYRWTW